MPAVTLPDGSQRSYPHPVTVAEIAQSIGTSLGKAALAGKVNGQLVDTSYVVSDDATVSIITDKEPEGLEVIRHSTAHLLAQAVKQLYPQAQVTIGPVIEDGFYYDFAIEKPFTPDDLAKIEARMVELAHQDAPVIRRTMPRNDAIAFFRQMGELYKAEIIESIPEGEVLSLYQQGDFTDLCRGPHVPNVGKLKAFKLTKFAGAYWRGDSKNAMLQRIYGTAWSDQAALQSYLHRIEEAEKRDHRKIGKQLDLFHLQEEAPGMVFWHPNGWAIYQVIEQYIRSKLLRYGYQEIRTPQVLDRSLWEKSGHWSKYRENMFVTCAENHDFAIKPMSCPGHVQVFNQGLKSYRDLPLRLAEFGLCHRNEYSGALHGLMRVRSFTQDDAHIFCTEDQLFEEITQLINMVFEIYHDFGFTDIESRLSTRPDVRVGSEETWDKAEKTLEDILTQKGLKWELAAGDGAFYGPKIDFTLRDCLGRGWQCGTIQLDFSMPERLDAAYVTEEGVRKPPVMVHRAILGTLERFIGVLIEHVAGKFPPWLAPTQGVVMTITDNQAKYAAEVTEILKNRGFRIKSDLRNEKIGFKIREHTIQKIPYLLVVGDREVENRTIAVRDCSGKDLGTMPLDEFSEMLSAAVSERGRFVFEE